MLKVENFYLDIIQDLCRWHWYQRWPKCHQARFCILETVKILGWVYRPFPWPWADYKVSSSLSSFFCKQEWLGGFDEVMWLAQRKCSLTVSSSHCALIFPQHSWQGVWRPCVHARISRLIVHFEMKASCCTEPLIHPICSAVSVSRCGFPTHI